VIIVHKSSQKNIHEKIVVGRVIEPELFNKNSKVHGISFMKNMGSVEGKFNGSGLLRIL